MRSDRHQSINHSAFCTMAARRQPRDSEMNPDCEYDEKRGLLMVPIILIIQFMENLLATCPLRQPIEGLPCSEPDCPTENPVAAQAFMKHHHIGQKRKGYWVTTIRNHEVGLHAAYWVLISLLLPWPGMGVFTIFNSALVS